MTFDQKVETAISVSKSLLCVGLDTDFEKIPNHLKTKKQPQLSFNQAIIDATHDVVCAYKPNVAFYESRGLSGVTELQATCAYIKQTYPEKLLILDAKRADIGNTNDGYVRYAFEYLGVDAITLHPYLGREALHPFLSRPDSGCIILCRTSNPGAGEFQDVQSNGKPLYQIVAEKVANEWNQNNNCMLVVGATYPEEMKQIRSIVGDMTFLVPGIGAQGGDVQAVVAAGINSKNRGMIINASRSIIFASNDVHFDYSAHQEAKKLHELINSYRKEVV